MKVQIWTDGSCYPNPGGPGGWAYILRYGDREWEGSGSLPPEMWVAGRLVPTSNIRAELMAAIRGLSAIPKLTLALRPKTVVLTTDLEYVRRAMTTGFRKVKANQDLLRKLALMTKLYRPQVQWVRGHDGHPENSRCDKLAEQARIGAHPDQCVEVTDGADYGQQPAAAPATPSVR